MTVFLRSSIEISVTNAARLVRRLLALTRPIPGLDLVTADPPVKYLGLSSGPCQELLGLGFRA